MSRLDDLGKRLAAEQDRVLAERDDLAEVRRRLEAGPAATERRRWPRGALAAGLALLVGVGLALAWQAGTAESAPGDRRSRTVPEGWIAAPAGAGVPIRFADGSALQLEPQAEAWVASDGPETTRVVLRTGSAQVDVVHRPGARWVLDVGPFAVNVTGTQFHVGWDPVLQAFHLDLQRGEVRVGGPMLDEGRRMVAGDVLRVWVAERRVELRSGGTLASARRPETPAGTRPPPAPLPTAPAPTTPAPAVPPTPVAPPALPPVPHPTPAAPSASHLPRGTEPDRCLEPAAPSTPPPTVEPPPDVEPPATPSVTWRDLARQGRYPEATDAAEARGFAVVLAESSAPELLELGDAARLAGRAERATAAYNEARRRFPATQEAGVAAFSLARLSFDLLGEYDAAARWFQVCLEEPAAGGLAREALGRRVEALARAGQRTLAAAAAREYLARFPEGPHAAYARTLLEPEAAAP